MAELASGTHGTAREVARARVRSAPTNRPHWAAGERERGERVGGLARQAGSGYQGRQARGAGPDGLAWVEMAFFQGFSNCFSILFSLGFSIQIQTKFQIQTNSNMCNNSKNI